MVYLPDEIWLKVAEFVSPPADLCTCECESGRERNAVKHQNLINLCLVSKQLRAAFQPSLYFSFVKFSRPCAHDRLLTSDSEWLHKYFQRDEKILSTVRKATRLEKFMRTLIHRPDLAVMIKQLHIGSFFETSSLPGHLQMMYERLPLQETLASTFVTALRTFRGFERLPLSTKRSWLEDLRNGEEGAEVALLLILLPNLRSLRIESEQGDLGRYAQELYDALRDPGPTYWTIKSAHATLQKTPVGLQSQLQKPPQILKALKSLSVWSDCDGLGSLQRCVDLLSLPSLTSFDARGLEQFGSALQALFTRCTGLRSLVINSEYASRLDGPRSKLDAKFFAALQDLTGLERLTLLVPEYHIDSDLDVSSFEKLHYLEVDQDLFSHSQGHAQIHKNLPTSIQQLVIRRATVWIKPRLESFLGTFAPRPMFPDFSELRLYALIEEHDELEEELIGFQMRASLHDVDFEFDEEPAYNHSWFWVPDSDSHLKKTWIRNVLIQKMKILILMPNC
ncbi:hypothetical protein E4T50_10554 [Aureobasidium sp. EXF-12298]|nr:hypothetical protein E4T50_10554 [Aureobasidium sp. EXF-12298]